MKPVKSLTFQIGNDELHITVKGRDAWALSELMQAGEKGVTPISHPAPRWSAYVFNLRSIGVDVQTINEPHKGPYAGTHARYVLRSEISVLESVNAEA
jgi:hypothetical protein